MVAADGTAVDACFYAGPLRSIIAPAAGQRNPASSAPTRSTPKPPVATDVPQEIAAIGDIVVAGFAPSLGTELDLKRTSDVILDAISAVDAVREYGGKPSRHPRRVDRPRRGSFNQRARSRQGFTHVRINDLDALSTTDVLSGGPPAAAASSRGFDFNSVVSVLFNQASTRKTASAVRRVRSITAGNSSRAAAHLRV